MDPRAPAASTTSDRFDGGAAGAGAGAGAPTAPSASRASCRPVPDLPAACGRREHGVDGDLGEHLGPVGDGVDQVVHEHGVLGADVAAGDAVAAARAGGLLEAGGVGPGRERDVDEGTEELGTELLGRSSVGGLLGERRVGVRVRRGAQHVESTVEAGAQLGIGVVPERLRPRGVLEHPGVGLQGDVGVDQRRPAEAAADQDADVVGETEVVQPGPGPDVVAIGVGLHLAQGAERGARVLPRVELPAPLEDGDRHPGPGQPAGEDTAAIARSDHDDVVPGAHP